ncbi:MAG: PEP-CTERM system histidine kinase PrsK [Deferribacteres bacterium]|nr:PEP-CTERM system histidine kinase PrsK [Deferribacteres bacterium]
MLVISAITIIIALLTAFAVIFRRYRRLSNVAFFVSLLSTALVISADSMSVLEPEPAVLWERLVLASQALAAFSWLLFTLSFARRNYWGTAGRVSRFLIIMSPLALIFSLAAPLEVFFSPPEVAGKGILFMGRGGYMFYMLLLLYSVASIINLEATLKSSSGMNRWNLKYTLIGTGGIIAVNIFYYSHALLYHAVNLNLLPVRTGVTLISLLLIGFSLLRHKVMDVEISVSRGIILKSLSLFIVGLYLVGLGLIGEGMRYLGPETGKNITALLGFAGALLVLAIILSEQLRRRAAVFISKNFYRQKYDYRERWLQFTQRISMKHSFEDLLGAVMEGFRDAVGVKGASIWLREKGSGEYTCAGALDAPRTEIRPGRGLTEFMRNKKWVINIHDANCREAVEADSEFIKATDACLIVPLLNIDELAGFIVLREGLAGDDYDYEDYDLLKTLAAQSTAAILNAKLSEELAEAREMEAMGKLSSFIVHDLKNAAARLSLIAQNAGEHIDNPDFQRDAVRAVANTSEKIRDIVEKLKNVSKKTTLKPEYSDLGACVRSVVEEFKLNGSSRLSYEELESVKARFDKEEIVKVIINLIINALDATDRKGDVRVVVGRENDMAFVKVSDTGCGMSTEFIEKRLFRPFQTTKKKGFGIGLYQCKAIVDAHSGRLKVISRQGRGTDVFLYLPLRGD